MPSEKITTVIAHSMSGATIDSGRLQLLQLISAGMYGHVYKAIDTTSPPEDPTFYAVKVMPQYDVRTSTHHAHLQFQELAIHKDVCGHPNIVNLHTIVLNNDGYVYLVLDFSHAGDLEKKIRKGLFVSNDDRIKKVFLQIIDGLEHLHSKGVYHRDLKPASILLSEDLHVLIAEFGAATTAEQGSGFGGACRAYMSPECVGDPYIENSPPFSHRANDMWSLGVILFCMITGHCPWDIANTSDPCFEQYVDHPDLMYNLLDISSDAFRLIQRILTLDPSARIGLVSLRNEIEGIQTFFGSGEKEPLLGVGMRCPHPTLAIMDEFLTVELCSTERARVKASMKRVLALRRVLRRLKRPSSYME